MNNSGLVQQGVSIINFSAGFNYKNEYYDNNYKYTNIDWIVDNAINNYGLVFVKSAGNNGDYVTTPGKAYNAITVGNCDANTNMPYSVHSSSSYNEDTEHKLANKPDIVAPGTLLTFPNIAYPETGTSFAAPNVSGVAAQMIQCMPTLKLPSESQNQYGGKTYYNTVKALILLGANYQSISTVNNPSRMNGSNDDLLRDKSGAGLLDAKKTIDIILGNGYFRVIKPIGLNSNGTSPNGMNIYSTFDCGEKIRAVLCFSKIKQNSNSNLDLYVYDSYYTPLVNSKSLYNNVEIVEYQFPSYGDYTISADTTSTNIANNDILHGALVLYSEE